MRKKRMRWPVAGIVALGAVLYAASIQASPASGFTGTTLSLGRFASIQVKSRLPLPGARAEEFEDEDLWLSVQKTRGPSDLYVQNNVLAPGGTTGWHTHPGHSLITVTAGAVTAYEGDDPACAPHVYTAGMGFVDPGGGHVHVLRNEGAAEARTVAVQLLPAGAPRRVDAAPNPACPF